MQTQSILDKALIEFPLKEGNSSFWTVREAVEGVQIFGGIGSGKTSGSGRMLALKYLSNGFGGLVLTAKADEKDLWIQYCKEANRLNDLIIVEPGGNHFFNFLEYESSNKNGLASFTENVMQVLKTVIQSSEEKSSGKSDDPFWESALDMLIFNVIDLCKLAYGNVSVERLYSIVLTAPKKGEVKKEEIKADTFDHAFALAQRNVMEQIDRLQTTLNVQEKQKCEEDGDYMDRLIMDILPDAKLFRYIQQFFIEHYRNLSEKTRSIIEFSFSGFLFRLLKDPVYSLFCRHRSTFTPEDSLKGKIILLNLPVKHYFKVGRDSQVMFKYIWQRAMERRNVKENGLPVFLWADEAQHFLHEYDAEYQATARSSRIATVYISQNLPNYHANMGGQASEYRVKSFLGTLGTKIFHANADIDTNMYASALIGEAYTESIQKGRTISGSFSTSETSSYDLERMVRPEKFAGLKTGGPDNNYVVEGYMHRQSKSFSKDINYKKIIFNQNPT
jgi:hypothetical protein